MRTSHTRCSLGLQTTHASGLPRALHWCLRRQGCAPATTACGEGQRPHRGIPPPCRATPVTPDTSNLNAFTEPYGGMQQRQPRGGRYPQPKEPRVSDGGGHSGGSGVSIGSSSRSSSSSYPTAHMKVQRLAAAAATAGVPLTGLPAAAAANAAATNAATTGNGVRPAASSRGGAAGSAVSAAHHDLTHGTPEPHAVHVRSGDGATELLLLLELRAQLEAACCRMCGDGGNSSSSIAGDGAAADSMPGAGGGGGTDRNGQAASAAGRRGDGADPNLLLELLEKTMLLLQEQQQQQQPHRQPAHHLGIAPPSPLPPSFQSTSDGPSSRTTSTATNAIAASSTSSTQEWLAWATSLAHNTDLSSTDAAALPRHLTPASWCRLAWLVASAVQRTAAVAAAASPAATLASVDHANANGIGAVRGSGLVPGAQAGVQGLHSGTTPALGIALGAALRPSLVWLAAFLRGCCVDSHGPASSNIYGQQQDKVDSSYNSSHSNGVPYDGDAAASAGTHRGVSRGGGHVSSQAQPDLSLAARALAALGQLYPGHAWLWMDLPPEQAAGRNVDVQVIRTHPVQRTGEQGRVDLLQPEAALQQRWLGWFWWVTARAVKRGNARGSRGVPPEELLSLLRAVSALLDAQQRTGRGTASSSHAALGRPATGPGTSTVGSSGGMGRSGGGSVGSAGAGSSGPGQGAGAAAPVNTRPPAGWKLVMAAAVEAAVVWPPVGLDAGLWGGRRLSSSSNEAGADRETGRAASLRIGLVRCYLDTRLGVSKRIAPELLMGLVRSGALPHVAPRDLTELLLLHEALGSPLQGEAAGPVVQVLLPLLPHLPGEQLLWALRGLSTATQPLHTRHVAQLDAAVAARLWAGTAARPDGSSSSSSTHGARIGVVPVAAARTLDGASGAGGVGVGPASVGGRRQQEEEEQQQGAVERGAGHGDGGGGGGVGTGASRAPAGSLLRGVQLCEALVCVARMAARHRCSMVEPFGGQAAEASAAAAEGAGCEGVAAVAGATGSGGGGSSVQSPSGGGRAEPAAAFQVSLDAGGRAVRSWLGTCTASELVQATRTLLRARSILYRRQGQGQLQQEEVEGEEEPLERAQALVASSNGQVPAALDAPAAADTDGPWLAFESAANLLLESDLLPPGELLRLAVDLSYEAHGSLSATFRKRLLAALAGAVQRAACAMAGMPDGQAGDTKGAGARGHADRSRGRDRGRQQRIGGGGQAGGLTPDEVAYAAAAAARLACKRPQWYLAEAAAHRLASGVVVAAQGMRPAALAQALWALGELQVPGLSPAGADVLLRVLHHRLPVLPPQHLPLLLQGLACIRLRPHPAWMVSYSRLVRQHLYTYGPAQLAQLVWSYGQLTPAPPYARLYFRPPKQLVRELLRCSLAVMGGPDGRHSLQPADAPDGRSEVQTEQPQEQPRRQQRRGQRPAALCSEGASMLLFGLACLECRPSSRWLRAFLRWSAPRLPSFRARDLAMTLFALARLEARPPPAWTRRAVRCAADRFLACTALDTAQLAHGLARLGPELVTPRLMSCFEACVPLQLQHRAQSAAGAEQQEQAEAAWAGFLRAAYLQLRERVRASATMAASRSRAMRRGRSACRVGGKAVRGSGSRHDGVRGRGCGERQRWLAPGGQPASVTGGGLWELGGVSEAASAAGAGLASRGTAGVVLEGPKPRFRCAWRR